MYKDPDKQREANRKAQAKFKAKGITIETKGITDVEIMQGITKPEQGVTDERPNEPANVIPKQTFEEFSKTHIVATVVSVKPKRGKDIKVFSDLPPDVQATIDKMSMVDGKIDKTVKANRTAIAINYQHIFPDRFNSVGVAG